MSLNILFVSITIGTLINLSYGGVSYSLSSAEAVILMLFLLAILKHRGNIISLIKRKKMLYILWALCLVYSVLTYFWTGNITNLAGSLSLFFVLITLFVADNYMDIDFNNFITANRLMMLSLFLQLIISMSGVLLAKKLSFYDLKHISNTLAGNSNYISIYLSFGLILEFIAKEKRWMIYSLICFLGVALTMSRGAIITIVFVMAIYLVVAIVNKKVKVSYTIYALAVVAVIFFLYVKFTLPGHQLWASLKGIRLSSFGTRWVLWVDALKEIKLNPFGNGIVWRGDPHNVILKAVRDLGIIIGPVYILLIAYPLKNLFNMGLIRKSNRAFALLLAYLSVLIHSMIEIFYFTNKASIWIMVILVILQKVIDSEKSMIYYKKS